MVIEISDRDQPHSDSGEPVQPFGFVDEMIRRTVAAEMRAIHAERCAEFYAGCALLFLLSALGMIVVMAWPK